MECHKPTVKNEKEFVKKNYLNMFQCFVSIGIANFEYEKQLLCSSKWFYFKYY